jgi:hypothetical protein
VVNNVRLSAGRAQCVFVELRMARGMRLGAHIDQRRDSGFCQHADQLIDRAVTVPDGPERLRLVHRYTGQATPVPPWPYSRAVLGDMQDNPGK